jgi:hypothetical protein
VLFPDGRNQFLDNLAGAATPLLALGAGIAGHAARKHETVEATFTFTTVHPQFARELDRLRNLTPQEYEQMFAQANAKFLADLHDHAIETAEERQRRLEKEQQLALDEESFHLQEAVGKGAVAQEVTRSDQSKLFLVGLLVGAMSLVLLMCISASVIGYVVLSRKPADDAARKPALDPPKEQRAKVKLIDTDERTIQFLMPNSAKQTLKYTDNTVFYDRQANKLAQGVEAVNVDDFCVILPTDDRKGLQWLKLTDAP